MAPDSQYNNMRKYQAKSVLLLLPEPLLEELSHTLLGLREADCESPAAPRRSSAKRVVLRCSRFRYARVVIGNTKVEARVVRVPISKQTISSNSH